MKLSKFIKRTFEKGNVSVCGLRGTGKDVLMGNVIARRHLPYISNLYYGYMHIPFNYRDIDCGENTYKQFLEGDVKNYKFPYPYGTDIYLSDAGIYFPSHEHKNLEKTYPYLPTYMALSRQVSRNNVHFNVQNLTRCWDKIREQSDIFIRCFSCKVVFGVAFIRVVVYDNIESAVNGVKPCPIRPKGLNRDRRQEAKIYQEKFRAQYGSVKGYTLIFRNLSVHDTYYFERLLNNDKK